MAIKKLSNIPSFLFEEKLLVRPGEHDQVYETHQTYMWIGIPKVLVAVSKQEAPDFDREIMKEEMEETTRIMNNQPFGLIADISFGKPQPKADRDAMAKLQTEKMQAVALLSSNALMRMTANILFTLNPPKIKYKMFGKFSEAQSWIQEQL